MEQFIFRTPEFYRLYNCSFYNVDDIPIEQRTHVGIGISFLVLFCISELLYVIVLIIMWRPEFFSKSCYKIMFFMGINDVVCIFDNGFLMGYFDIAGFVFCSAPNFLFVHGAAADTMWAIQSGMGIVLAINRCIEMHDKNINIKLFGGKRVYIWMIVVVLYAGTLGFFGKPHVFTGLHVTLFSNPHAGYFEDLNFEYANIFHTVHNLGVLVLLSVCYVVFVILLFRKTGGFHGNLKESFYQVFIICLFNTVAASTYSYMQFFPVGEWLILVAQYAWFFAHAGPAFIYSFFNKTIRKHIIKALKTQNFSFKVTSVHPQVTVVSTTHNS